MRQPRALKLMYQSCDTESTLLGKKGVIAFNCRSARTPLMSLYSRCLRRGVGRWHLDFSLSYLVASRTEEEGRHMVGRSRSLFAQDILSIGVGVTFFRRSSIIG